MHGGEVKVSIKDNAPAFEIVSAPPKAKKKGRKAAGEAEGGDAPASPADEGQPEAQA
jgi:ATP-dependent Clp protease ATP-binding subunit ClpA